MRGRRGLTGLVALAWSMGVSAGVSANIAAAAGPVRAGQPAAVPRGTTQVMAPTAPTPLPVPGGPALTSLQGKAANGVQASLTVPTQLPLDPAAQALPRRPIDVEIDNGSGAAVTGDLQVTMTAVAAGSGTAAFPQSLQQYSTVTSAWQDAAAADVQGATWSHMYSAVTVGAAGSIVEHFRMSGGTAPLTGIKVTVTLGGATVTTTIPVTSMTFTVAGLPGTVQGGVPATFTGTLTNPTDVPYSGVGFAFTAQACAGCLRAQDVTVQYQKAGVWAPIALQSTSSGLSGTIGGGLSLAAGGTVQVPLQLTVADAAVAAGPLQVSLQAAGLPVPSGASSASVAVVPGATLTSGVRTGPPSATPSDTASQTPSVSASSSSQSPAPSDSASAPDGASATPSLAQASAGSGSSDATSVAILAAAGALAVSIALLGWYFLWRKQQQARLAAAREAAPYPHEEDYADHSGHSGP